MQNKTGFCTIRDYNKYGLLFNATHATGIKYIYQPKCAFDSHEKKQEIYSCSISSVGAIYFLKIKTTEGMELLGDTINSI